MPKPLTRAALAASVLFAPMAAPQIAIAEDLPRFELTIENHRFTPTAITVPAGKKVVLVVTNKDATREEFESYELNREQMIAGGSQAEIYIGPLKPGSYHFFGEFHQRTAKGYVIAK